MNRRKFIRNAAIASTAIAVGGGLVASIDDAPTQYDVMAAIKTQLDNSTGIPAQIFVGWENDDFLNNVMTIHGMHDGKEFKFKYEQVPPQTT